MDEPTAKRMRVSPPHLPHFPEEQVFVPVHVNGRPAGWNQVLMRPVVPWEAVEWRTTTCESKKTSGIVQLLNKKLPLIQFGMEHAKRVVRVDDSQRILVAPVSCAVSESVLDVIGNFDAELQVLPRYAPLYQTTKVEWSERCKWPLKPLVRPLLPAINMPEDEIAKLKEYMTLAVAEAEKGSTGVGVVLVNGNGTVSTTEHGGSCCIGSKHPNRLDHACMLAIDSIANRHRERKEQLEYICTGYDVFSTREPCLMCSMALVHSRVRRVFYGSPNPLFGGLGSCEQLQSRKSLNHHFEVYCKEN